MAQAPSRVVVVDGKAQQFPADATDAEISAALNAIPLANAPHAPKARTWNDLGGSALVGAGKALPAVANAVEGAATSPTLPKTAATVGRMIGGVAPVVTGAVKGGPVGAMVGLAASSKGAWAGGKTGWFTGKMAQGVAAPVAKVLQDVAPYAQALSTLGGVQGGLDLAQMAEPNRKDIGVLGVGTSDEPRSAADKAAHPALINLALSKVSEAVKYLMDQGMKQSEAVRTVMNAKADRSRWDKRADGSTKGDGFLGVLQRPDGKVSSEISVGVNINGKEVEIPTMVPTLSQQEVQWLLTNDVSDPRTLPKSIIEKAVAFARPRIAAGKSPFAGPDESPKGHR